MNILVPSIQCFTVCCPIPIPLTVRVRVSCPWSVSAIIRTEDGGWQTALEGPVRAREASPCRSDRNTAAQQHCIFFAQSSFSRSAGSIRPSHLMDMMFTQDPIRPPIKNTINYKIKFNFCPRCGIRKERLRPCLSQPFKVAYHLSLLEELTKRSFE